MYKKIFLLLIIVVTAVSTTNAFSAVLPHQLSKQNLPLNFADSSLYLLTHLSVKQIQKLVGRKLNFKEKIALKLYKSNPQFYNKLSDSTYQDKFERKARWAKWLGLGSLIGLIVPGIGLLSLPAAIVAIVFGASTINKVKDKRNSRQGIIFGTITIGLILLAILVVILILASYGIE